MAKQEWTPGPWTNHGQFICVNTLRGKLIATVHDCMDVNRTTAEMAKEIDVIEAAANNRLICAAPDLLEALQMAVACLKDHNLDELMAGEFEILEDAIKKALGE